MTTDPQKSSALSDEDKEKLTTMTENTMKWLDSHPLEDADVYEKKMKDCQQVSNPIITKMYQQAGGQGSTPDMSMPDLGDQHKHDDIEEVD